MSLVEDSIAHAKGAYSCQTEAVDILKKYEQELINHHEEIDNTYKDFEKHVESCVNKYGIDFGPLSSIIDLGTKDIDEKAKLAREIFDLDRHSIQNLHDFINAEQEYYHVVKDIIDSFEMGAESMVNNAGIANNIHEEL